MNIRKSTNFLYGINRLKEKSLTDDKNDKFQHLLIHDETLGKLGIIANFFNLKNSIYQKLASDSTLICKTVNPVPLNKEQDGFNSHLLFNLVLRALSNTTVQEKERKPIGIRKDHSKLHPSIQSFPLFIQCHLTCTVIFFLRKQVPIPLCIESDTLFPNCHLEKWLTCHSMGRERRDISEVSILICRFDFTIRG